MIDENFILNYKEKPGLFDEFEEYLKGNNEWNSKGVQTSVFLISIQWISAAGGLARVCEQGYRSGLCILDKGFMIASYDSRDFRRLGEFLLKKYKEDDWPREYYDKFKKASKKLEEVAKKVYFGKIKKSDLRKTFLELLVASVAAQSYGYITESFNLMSGEYWVTKHLKDLAPQLSEEEVQDLLRPGTKSLIQRYHEDINRFDTDDIKKKWYWIKGSYYAQPELTEQNVAEDREKPGKVILFDKKPILSKLSDEVKKYIDFVELFIRLQDERKENVMRMNYAFNKLMTAMSSEFKIDKEILFSLLPLEVLSVIDGNKPDFDKMKKRIENSVCLFTPSAYEITSDKDKISFVKELFRVETDEIKGYPACKGKVKGRVKIILSEKDFDKMEQGDVLVTYMTRPEFMPVINKASAIIADEGGITCHAAIVARELNKPCVIGTRIATRIIKDGDYVEVDADKGVVKVIKRI